ncbi:MAG: aspartate--tRNA ligase [Candidatus Omnitrophica bacterium]|nr:aspartate--tRNA ligase [Candidatus Omnitrophota bacterium]
MFKRTHNCGELTDRDIGKEVALSGWINTWRDHGGVVFIDLRDREGITQIVFNPDSNKDLHKESRKLRTEYVISVKGKVGSRPEGTVNTKLKTGKIEVVVSDMDILNTSATPPFEITDDAKISEEIKLTYRYLDLRRPAMQKNLRIRHKTVKAIRDFLDSRGFLEVETPILTKSTPEGARDYLVPSRLNAGKFYALPQSPQLFKQILMVSGCEKYFQIAKCFRDEDLRADRQPEFTQLDMEMSFVDEEGIYGVCEELMKYVFGEVAGVTLKTPFPRLTYSEAMSRFGTDKPDMRFGMELKALKDIFKGSGFKVFESAINEGGGIFGMNAKGMAVASRKELDDITRFAQDNGAKGLAWIKFTEKGAESPIAKFFEKERIDKLANILRCETGDLALMVADKTKIAEETMGALRLHIARLKNIELRKGFAFAWIVDFPLLKYNEEEKRWESEHHPFTSCKDEDMELLEREPQKARAKAYDLIVNGIELGSGSIRIHRRDLQEKIFKAIGISKEESLSRFGFLLKAFTYGAPPHGGVAFGLDRWLTLFTNSDTIRDVIAFPKTQKGICPLSDAPSEVDQRQLKELNLRLTKVQTQ